MAIYIGEEPTPVSDRVQFISLGTFFIVFMVGYPLTKDAPDIIQWIFTIITLLSNKKAGSTPSLTTGQFGYLLEQTSQKGTKYYQFKGQQVPQGMAIPSYADAAEPSQPAQPAPSQAPVHPSDQKEMPYWFAPYAMKINFIYEEMKGVSDKPMTQQQALDGAKKADESYGNKAYGNETYGDQKISKDELEDIFGGPMSEPVSLEDK